jgi:hypothetical protein
VPGRWPCSLSFERQIGRHRARRPIRRKRRRRVRDDNNIIEGIGNTHIYSS